MDRIKIHNFGPVKDVDIELSKLMVFIGPQGSGKSTIAKLLTIFSDVYWWITICNNKNPMSEFKKMGIAKYFVSDTYIEYHGRSGVNIVYSDGKYNMSIDGYSAEETIGFCAMLIGKSTNDNLAKLGYKIDGMELEIGDKETEEQLYKKTLNNIKENYNYIRANMRFACYIPAERNMAGVVSSSLANIILSKIPLPNTLMEYMSLFERAKNHYVTFDASFLGVRYDKDRGTDCISVFGETEKQLPLEECSSGVQSTLPMLMVADYVCEDKCFDTFVVEEPEQNLFPTNQREVLNRLISIANREECRYMIINTHSPYMLSALNVSMLAAKVSKIENYKDEVDAIVSPEFRIDTDNVAVYALGGTPCCKSIIDNKTGLISVNYLDVISDTISSDFNRLYRIYLNTLHK